MTVIQPTTPEEIRLSPAITFRAGTLEDYYTVYRIFQQSVLDLSQRLGTPAISGGQDEAALSKLWERRRPLFEHLARTAEHFWLAEKDGLAIGYARSVLRGGLRELTEFFVLPDRQSAGVGRELLRRTFPSEGATRRAIIATIDSRALVRYLKAKVYPRFASSYFSRSPENVNIKTDLSFEPINFSPPDVALLRGLDETLLGHERDVDHVWLLGNRQGYIYRRAGRPVGYGYVGQYNGPFALLNERDFPAVLAHAEREAAAQGAEFGVEVPLINRSVVEYLLLRGYHMDAFITLFMSDEPFGKFENYIFPSPPFFL